MFSDNNVIWKRGMTLGNGNLFIGTPSIEVLCLYQIWRGMVIASVIYDDFIWDLLCLLILVIIVRSEQE